MQYQEIALWIMRLAPALCMVVFGINQIMKPGDWLHYIPDWAKRSSPMSPIAQMKMHAAGNIAFGLFLASGWHPLIGAWVALIWWVSILPFAFKSAWAVGMRDLTIILMLAALVLMLTK